MMDPWNAFLLIIMLAAAPLVQSNGIAAYLLLLKLYYANNFYRTHPCPFSSLLSIPGRDARSFRTSHPRVLTPHAVCESKKANNGLKKGLLFKILHMTPLALKLDEETRSRGTLPKDGGHRPSSECRST